MKELVFAELSFVLVPSRQKSLFQSALCTPLIYLKKADSTILLKPATSRKSIPLSIVSPYGHPALPFIVSNSLHILETSCSYSINGYVLIQMYGTIWQEPRWIPAIFKTTLIYCVSCAKPSSTTCAASSGVSCPARSACTASLTIEPRAGGRAWS